MTLTASPNDGVAAVSQVSEVSDVSEVDDETVVRRVLGGERLLFELLMRRNNARVYRAVRAILGSDAEVEDVMQQAYVSAFEHLAQFQGGARFSTWLTKIAIHAAYARLRKRRPLVALADPEHPAHGGIDMSDLPSPRPGPDELVSQRELGALLETVVDALPELYRTVFVLREVDELSTAETAACLEVSEEVVKTRLHRARALLRDELAARVGASAATVFAFHATRCDRVVAAVLARVGSSAG